MAYVTFWYSAMYGNKTNHLLCTYDNFERRNLKPLIMIPSMATKDGIGVISSRALDMKKNALLVDDEYSIYDNLMKYMGEYSNKPSIILIDEINFLNKKDILDIMFIAHILDIRIDCYGLRTNSNGELFEGSKYLLGYADNIRELETFNQDGIKNTMNMLVVDGKIVKDGIAIQPNAIYTTGSWKDWLKG